MAGLGWGVDGPGLALAEEQMMEHLLLPMVVGLGCAWLALGVGVLLGCAWLAWMEWWE